MKAMITIELEEYENMKVLIDKLSAKIVELNGKRKSIDVLIYEKSTMFGKMALQNSFGGTHTQLVALIKNEIQPNIDACNRTN